MSDEIQSLGMDYAKRQFALREAGKMGILWAFGGEFYLSQPPFGGLDTADHIKLDKLKEQIDYWYPRVLSDVIQRKGPQTEYRVPGYRKKFAIHF